MANYVCMYTALLLLYFCLYVNQVNKDIVFVFGAFVYHFNNTISIFVTLFTYLLTYLIGHNNPINGFRPAATYPSRRFCSLRAYVSWLHQSLTGLPRFGLYNECKVVLFVDFHRSPHQIPDSSEHPPPYERHGRARAAAGY